MIYGVRPSYMFKGWFVVCTTSDNYVVRDGQGKPLFFQNEEEADKVAKSIERNGHVLTIDRADDKAIAECSCGVRSKSILTTRGWKSSLKKVHAAHVDKILSGI